MTNAATRALQGLLKWAFAIGIVTVGLLALLVAWWIALLVIGAWVLYATVQRLFRGKSNASAPRTTSAIIDGEYRVEHESHSESQPRALESADGRAKD
ncbi:MAG: hypothetical protein EXR28_02865 [Betaproteobacteria bacterium]|nr:hypothetical protein [Betaproteobacteria bacterium]